MFDISNELSTIESSEMMTLFFAFNSVIAEYKSVLTECYTVNINHTLVVNCQRLKTKYNQKLPPNEPKLAVKLAVKTRKSQPKSFINLLPPPTKINHFPF